jgi:hypothetical protein
MASAIKPLQVSLPGVVSLFSAYLYSKGLYMKKRLKEGAMSELNLAAQESPTFEAFLERVKQDFPAIAADVNSPNVKEFLKNIYEDAQNMKESKLDIRKIIREEIAKALGEAVNPELDNAVKRFVAGLATKYGYSDRDAVMAIFEGLKRLQLLDKNVNYKGPGMAEAAESAFEDEFALDNSKGGTDNSMNKIHRQLLKLQTQMNELMVLWKDGKMDLKTYVAKRKPLQDLRNKLEASLVAI